MKTCDLHTHSIYSDGSWTPAQLIDEAERIGHGGGSAGSSAGW